MHFNVCVFIPVKKPLDMKTPRDYIEGLVDSHIANFNEEFGSGPGRYDWYEIGGRWAGVLPSKLGECDFCMLEDFRPFPRISKGDKEMLARKYKLATLPAPEITDAKREEASKLDVTIFNDIAIPVEIPTFQQFCENTTFYFPYSYVTHDEDWVDGDDWTALELRKQFKEYVKGIKKNPKLKNTLVVNVDCHI